MASSLDRALRLLRDMVDSKASMSDVRRAIAALERQEDYDASSEALTGFRGFRCLGCNRKLDALRPRPAGSSANALDSPPISIRKRSVLGGGMRPASASLLTRSPGIT